MTHPMTRLTALGAAWLAAAISMTPPRAQEAGALGATVEPLLEIGRRMSPDLGAGALEVEAALARAEAAASLPDPEFRASFEDMARQRGDVLPDRLGSVFYSVQQEFPLWGKRELRRNQAKAEAGSERARQRLAELELSYRIKTAFAAYFGTHEALRLIGEQAQSTATLNAALTARFAGGRASQQDVIAARLESAEIEAERIVLTAARRKAAAQINALTNRPAQATLAPPLAFRAMPPAEALTLDPLIERAWRDNPGLAEDDGRIEAAEHGSALVAKSWYPDLTLGLSAVDRDRRLAGYEAMVQFKLPLRWGLREAQEREASAKLGAARARRDARRLRLQAEVEAALLTIQAAVSTYRLLHEAHIPQSEQRLRAALAGLESGRGTPADAIDAQRQIRRVAREHLKASVDQQVGLAELERLIGGEL